MIGHELAVEETVPADSQPRHQPGERNLGSVAAQREHAFAKERRAEIYAVEAADQFAFLPAFHRMSMAELVELVVARFDTEIDPGLFPLGA